MPGVDAVAVIMAGPTNLAAAGTSSMVRRLSIMPLRGRLFWLLLVEGWLLLAVWLWNGAM